MTAVRPRIAAVGLHHALGLASRAAVLAARANQLEVRRSCMVDARGDRVGAILSRSIELDREPFARVVTLARPALREALAGAEPGPLRCFVAVPPEAPSAFLQQIAAEAGRPLDRASQLVRGGHAAFVAALDAAREALWSGATDVVVGGVSSPCLPGTIARLERADVLWRPGAERGRIPAEAAAFLRLRLGDEPHATSIVQVERDHEDRLGEGALGRLLRRVAGGVRGGGLDAILVDTTGEARRSACWSADCRVGAGLVRAAEIEPVVVQLGDTDAASGAVFAAVAAASAASGARAWKNAALALRSDDGEVGVVAMDLAPPSAPPPSTSRVALADAERAHLDHLARSLLEDVGGLALQAGDGRADARDGDAATSTRLRAALDAFEALGAAPAGALAHPDLPGAIARYLAELDPPNRPRVLAADLARRRLGL